MQVLDNIEPPEKFVALIGGSFQSVGAEFFRYALDLGGLKPGQAVLDIGCGCGRLAVPLARYLDERGRYEGFDITPEAIEWCRANITSVRPNFRFAVADIKNTAYNPAGSIAATDYGFPYRNRSFHFAIAMSVFTHLMPEVAEHYLREIARTLKPGGKLLSTWFLWNRAAETLAREGHAAFNFPYPLGPCRVQIAEAPEAAVTFDEAWVHETFARAGLVIQNPIQYGSWCGRSSHLSVQDIIVASPRRSRLTVFASPLLDYAKSFFG